MNVPFAASILRRLLPLGVLAALGAGIASAADLTVDRNAAVPFALDWGTQTVTAEIVNEGAAAAGEFVVSLGISHPSSLAATRPQSERLVVVSGLAPGERISISVAIAEFKGRGIDPKGLRSGLLEIRIDPTNAVEETNENNNYFSHVF